MSSHPSVFPPAARVDPQPNSHFESHPRTEAEQSRALALEDGDIALLGVLAPPG